MLGKYVFPVMEFPARVCILELCADCPVATVVHVDALVVVVDIVLVGVEGAGGERAGAGVSVQSRAMGFQSFALRPLAACV